MVAPTAGHGKRRLFRPGRAAKALAGPGVRGYGEGEVTEGGNHLSGGAMRQTLSLANQLSELDKLSQWVERMGGELDLSPRQVFHLNLALEEVVTNVMKYAYGPGIDLPIGVEMEAGPELVRVRVTDQGSEFNPLALPPPATDASLEDRRVGGVGIYLTAQIMDKLSYARQGRLNVLTLELARRERDGRDAAGGDSDGDH